MPTEPLRVTLKPGRAKPLWYGHPWVYSEAVERAEGVAPGDEVVVVDHDGRFIGRGFANPRSQIFVRVAERADRPLDEGWLRGRLQAARALRARLGLPSTATDAYRLVNSEGDLLPGLVVDVFGDSAVVQITTMAMKRREAQIFDAVWELLAPRTLYEATSGGAAQKVEGFVAQARVARGESRPEVPCRENGSALVVEPLVGQKTGWFLDQRENRAFVGALARGARVLDLYTYAGGFSLAAARGGAVRITAVDVSPRALERARQNFALNGLDVPDLVEADVFRYLEAAPAGAFELVICDPPKFARARKDLDAALRGYRRLNTLALAACAEDAILATASCSQLVDDVAFERMLAGAAKDAHRTLQVMHIAYQAADHSVPVAFPEGRYLKMFVCRVT
jgi:23S rRNA (cytosine1962-C5)-methyltransferase